MALSCFWFSHIISHEKPYLVGLVRWVEISVPPDCGNLFSYVQRAIRLKVRLQQAALIGQKSMEGAKSHG
eukprot:1157151-Pelagomonas_calceolata.AAC.11